jgi:hypothetical protein
MPSDAAGEAGGQIFRRRGARLHTGNGVLVLDARFLYPGSCIANSDGSDTLGCTAVERTAPAVQDIQSPSNNNRCTIKQFKRRNASG